MMQETENLSLFKPWQRRIAKLLIASLCNPALPMGLGYSQQANARDTDIYLSSVYSGSTAEPAVLLVLDTSDSMNIPEPWREYDPSTYDSHVEYLWNSPNYMDTISSDDVNSFSNPTDMLNSAGSSTYSFAPAYSTAAYRTVEHDSGWWSRKGKDGGTLSGTDLKNAALAYANGTQSGDPGPRKLYRHYAWSNSQDCGYAGCGWRGSHVLLYWLPVTDSNYNDANLENDSRLRSDSLNKIWGSAQTTDFGNTNPDTNPITRGGIKFGKYAAYANDDPATNYLSNNRCTSSKAKLEPSTVYAPSAYPRNAGKVLNQYWVRWTKYADLDDSRVSQYPGFTDLTTNDKIYNNLDGSTHYKGYLDGYRDRDNPAYCGQGEPNLPVRTQKSSSHAGWLPLSPDGGGYNVARYRMYEDYDYLNSCWNNDVLSQTSKLSLIKETVKIYYPNATSTSDTWATMHIKVNKLFPFPDYYDTPNTVSVLTKNDTITKTRSCTGSSTTPYYQVWSDDAGRKYKGGTCTQSAADNNCNDQSGACKCSSSDATACAAVPDPAACAIEYPDQTYYTQTRGSCGWQGTTTTKNANYANCKWTGRLSKTIEGAGTYYYGGTCSGSCTGSECSYGSTSTNYCDISSSGNGTFGGTYMTNYRTDSATAGCDNKGSYTYYIRSSCNGKVLTKNTPYTSKGDTWSTTRSTAACQNTSAQNFNINGTNYNNVTSTNGYYDGCYDLGLVDGQTCTGVIGDKCTVCNDQTSSKTVTASTPYSVYDQVIDYDNPYYMVDCLDDGGSSDSNGYVKDTNTYPATFGTWQIDAQGYTTSAKKALPKSAASQVNVYHSNYLNWKFGAKACRKADGTLITATADLDQAVTCNPIGRKTRLQSAKDALTDLVTNTNGVRFGLMVFNQMSSSLTSEGGNITFPISTMGSSVSDTNRQALITKINSLTAKARTPLTETMYEAYRYFRGEAPVFGTLTTPARSGGTVSDERDVSAVSGGKYVSPMMSNPNSISPAKCQKNYIVLVTDGGPEDDSSADSAVKALSQTINATLISPKQATTTQQFEATVGTPFGTTDLADNSSYIWLDELAYYMANVDMSPAGGTTSDSLAGIQPVYTYTIGFAGGNTPVLINAAAKGNGMNYLAEDSAALADALKKAITTIRDTAAPTAGQATPVSAYNKTENSDEVYMAFFNPRTQQAWDGTVKKYKMSTDSTACGTRPNPDQSLTPIAVPICHIGQTDLGSGLKNIYQYDRDESDSTVISAKIRDAAVSFWSNTNSPDGPKADAGGTGYVLINSSGITPYSRKVYTHLSAETQKDLTNAANALSESNTAITKTLLGDATMSDATRSTLINYARGGDQTTAACSDALTSTQCTTWRAWAHGDVVHSNPTVLTYDPNPDNNLATNDAVSYLFYMSNDGLLHAVNTSDGKEAWAFMPEESLGSLAGIMANANGEHITAGDGSPVIYVNDSNKDGKIDSSDKAYLFFGLRRGGRAMYALDISDKNTPKFLWKIDNSSSGFTELGETWSTPGIAKLRATTDPVLIFGAGYDPVPNDYLDIYIERSGTTATVTTSIDHGYATNDSVTIAGADDSKYNGTKTITVTGSRTFTYTVTGSPSSPATGSKRTVFNNKTATMGRGVFFVNGRTGTLIRSFTPRVNSTTNTRVTNMNFSIPSDINPLNMDLDSSGYADRAYVGDLGGNIWRLDFDSATPSEWTITHFADLTNGASPRRKIAFPPSVVKQTYAGQRYDAIYIGTGDKENPLRTDNADLFFMIKDTNTGLSTTQTSAIAYSTTDFLNITDNKIQLGSDSEKAQAIEKLTNGKGWVLTIGDSDTRLGEKVVNAPSVYFNTLTFGTYSPLMNASACEPPGSGSTYIMDAKDGKFVADTNYDGSINSSDGRRIKDLSSHGYPGRAGLYIKDGKIYLYTGGGSGGGGSADTKILGKAGVGLRTYWNQEPEK